MSTKIPNELRLFRQDLSNRGRLMFVETDERTQYEHTIWFDYTRKLFNTLKEGDILAVPNFSTDRDGTHWSLIEIMSVMPYHFALGGDKSDLQKAYPGFATGAVKNLSSDWIEQEDASLDDTTKIICLATPLNREILEASSGNCLQTECSLPMVGFGVEVLSDDLVEIVVNEGLDRSSRDVVSIGTLLRSEARGRPIDVFLSIDPFIKTHFGLFGFTGVGKSNLVSTIASSILQGNRRATGPTQEYHKIVLFDLMDEYKTLLIDQILEMGTNARIICIGERTLPGPIFSYLNTPANQRRPQDLEPAVQAFYRGFLFPRSLGDRRTDFVELVRQLVSSEVIRFVDTNDLTVQDFVDENQSGFFSDGMALATRTAIQSAIDQILTPRRNQILAPALATQLSGQFNAAAGAQPANSTAATRLASIEQALRRIAGQTPTIAAHLLTSINEMVQSINDEAHPNLLIVISNDSNEMRRFAFRFGNRLFEARRQRGAITPLVSVIFDEADEFIPGQAQPGSTQMESKRVIEQLARRGRKFGIGVGIATQRIAYMDTTIMGQMHTYFISKLPRKYDRDTVGEAFSMSEESFKQTFKFSKGDWLLVSHEAAGLESAPIPIHAPNAENRIQEYISRRGQRT